MHTCFQVVLILLFGVCLRGNAGATASPSAPAVQNSGDRKLPIQLARFDKDGDGKISSAEMPAKARSRLLSRYDKNKDDVLDVAELRALVADRRQQKGKRKKPAARREKRSTDPTPDARVRVIKDIAYTDEGSAAASLRQLDLYLPRDRREFPILLWIHGGGLHGGDKIKSAAVAERLVLHGFGVVSMNYRLSPAVKFPAHIEDVATAFRWVHDHIREYGGDRDRLFVTGGSAGGYLTILLALDERYLKGKGLSSKNIRAAIPISGLMDASRAGPGRLGTVWDDDPETLKKASPLSHVRADAPPILIMFADGEKPERARQNREMFDALRKIGHPNLELKVLKDRTHNTIRPNLAREDDPGLQAMLQFMSRHGADGKGEE